MQNELDLDTLAREMKTAQDQGCQVTPLTARYPGFDLPSAYRVAARLHRFRLDEGSVPIGRKIGFTNSAMWDVYGVRAPIWAYVYDRTVVKLDGNRAVCSLTGFCEPKIEPEIILHFHSAPVPGATLPELLEKIDWIANGFEVV